jgi:hypothetical protein
MNEDSPLSPTLLVKRKVAPAGGIPRSLDNPGRMRIVNPVPSQSDPANDRRLISGVFRIRFPPRYRDGMQRVVRNLLNPTDSTITAKNTITFENDNVLALAA